MIRDSGTATYCCAGGAGLKILLSPIQSAIRCGHDFSVVNFERLPILKPCEPLANICASTGLSFAARYLAAARASALPNANRWRAMTSSVLAFALVLRQGCRPTNRQAVRLMTSQPFSYLTPFNLEITQPPIFALSLHLRKPTAERVQQQ